MNFSLKYSKWLNTDHALCSMTSTFASSLHYDWAKPIWGQNEYILENISDEIENNNNNNNKTDNTTQAEKIRCSSPNEINQIGEFCFCFCFFWRDF